MMLRARHACVLGLFTLLQATSLGAQPVPPPTPPPTPPVEAVPPPPPAEAATPPAEVPPPPPPAPVPVAAGPRTAVIDAAPIGVDAAAGRYVTNVLREAIAAMGFQVVPQAELYDAARRLALPFPVPADGIFTLERALQTPLAVTAEVRAAQGQYVVHLRVRVAVEPEERTRDVTATQFQLGAAIREALPPLLVPPRVGQAPAGERPVSLGEPSAVDASAAPPASAPARRRRRLRAHPQRWELSVGAIAALGPGRDGFVNALVAARVSYFPKDRLGFSLSVDYVNLRGRDERVSNVLFLVGVETAVDLLPARRVFIPLRAEIGYLPQNGPVFRLTAGVSFSLSRRVRLNLDLLSPTLWVLPETTPVTLDLGAHLVVGL
ncbi:MAG: hypothetical protein IPF99_24655 [Deltaproteobacteria bacterium]|nr:hypothetical protein [Deltaproteobacteria bacterium]